MAPMATKDDDALDILPVINPQGIRRGSAAYIKIGPLSFLRLSARVLAQLQREINSLSMIAQSELGTDPIRGDAYCAELQAHAPEPTHREGGIAVTSVPGNGHLVVAFQFAEQLPVAIRLDYETARNLAAAIEAACPKIVH
jgi:hypothetical protein